MGLGGISGAANLLNLTTNNIVPCLQDAKKVRGNTLRPNANFGYDDDKGDYRVIPGDHVAYRYEVLSVLGMWRHVFVCQRQGERACHCLYALHLWNPLNVVCITP